MEYTEFLRQTEERLLRYAAVTTQSRHSAGVWPTTDCQRDLAKLLYEELLDLGLRAEYDEARCVVYGWIPSAHVKQDRSIALVTHMDTAPDEEVGGLARDLDLDRLGAKFAYTLDGDHLGWYQDQTFNAAEAVVSITGRSVHPATAKGIMVNASDLAAEFLNALPPKEKPQFTDGVEGFYYVTSLQSDCEHGEIRMIIRDFDRQNFLARQDRLLEIARSINEACGQERVLVTLNQQYRNMGDVLEQYPFLVADLEAAIRAAGLEPKSEPFRGGTDGSALSFRGLPSPNLSAGYENAHGRFEFVPVPSMAKNVEILIHLTEK